MRPKRRDDLPFWDMGGEAVMYDPARDMGHVLNATAAQVWSLCDGQHSLDDIERSLGEQFREQRDRLRGDLAAVIAQFDSLGLLEQGA